MQSPLPSELLVQTMDHPCILTLQLSISNFLAHREEPFSHFLLSLQWLPFSYHYDSTTYFTDDNDIRLAFQAGKKV